MIKSRFGSKMAANFNYLYMSELSSDIFVSALGFSWLNRKFPSPILIIYICQS